MGGNVSLNEPRVPGRRSSSHVHAVSTSGASDMVIRSYNRQTAGEISVSIQQGSTATLPVLLQASTAAQGPGWPQSSICIELQIRRLLTSTADINDAGQRRTPATLSGRRCSRRLQPDQARIELLKRVSQVRVLPGAQHKGPAQEGFPLRLALHRVRGRATRGPLMPRGCPIAPGRCPLSRPH